MNLNEDHIEPSETWKMALRTKINGALEFPVSKDMGGTSQPQSLYKTEWHSLFGGIGAQAIAEYLRATKKIAQLKEDTFEMEVERERQRRRSLEKSPFHRSDGQQSPSPHTSTVSQEDEISWQKKPKASEHAEFDSERRQAAFDMVEKELCCQDLDVLQIREELGFKMLELEERESEIERVEAQVNWRIYALRKKELELQKKDALMKAAWVEEQQRLHEREQQGDKDRRRLRVALAGLKEREDQMNQMRLEINSMRTKIVTMEEKWDRGKENKCKDTRSHGVADSGEHKTFQRLYDNTGFNSFRSGAAQLDLSKEVAEEFLLSSGSGL